MGRGVSIQYARSERDRHTPLDRALAELAGRQHGLVALWQLAESTITLGFQRPRTPGTLRRAAGTAQVLSSRSTRGPGIPARTASSWAANESPANSATELRKLHSSTPIVPASGPYVAPKESVAST